MRLKVARVPLGEEMSTHHFDFFLPSRIVLYLWLLSGLDNLKKYRCAGERMNVLFSISFGTEATGGNFTRQHPLTTQSSEGAINPVLPIFLIEAEHFHHEGLSDYRFLCLTTWAQLQQLNRYHKILEGFRIMIARSQISSTFLNFLQQISSCFSYDGIVFLANIWNFWTVALGRSSEFILNSSVQCTHRPLII